MFSRVRLTNRLLAACAVTLFVTTLAAAQTRGLPAAAAPAQPVTTRLISGVIIDAKRELVPNVSLTASSASGSWETRSDAGGNFRLLVSTEPVILKVAGDNLKPTEMSLRAGAEAVEAIEVMVEFVVPRVHESVVIVDSSLEPSVVRHDTALYRGTLFSRDDQVFQSLNAGIDAGQHEGGGKSLEIRRFGFNLDHGGVGGGLKVLVDGVQQNHSTQGHGQGYLGQLKSVTPELIEGVDIVNGPFSAQYGDFSGLGVVHLRLKEELPEQLTLRLQGGSFDSRRALLAYSPELKDADAVFAYEGARTDGPFLSPLRYQRDNLSGSYTRHFGERQAVGVKFSAARNDFFSSGQIPLDEVGDGLLDRFGFIDPDNGGRVRSATVGLYYRREARDGGSLKLDGFVTRSLFDLWSNFTFFLNDAERGDEIQQHDSRLQQGANVQYLRPVKLFGATGLFVAGGNFHALQTRVGLSRSEGRDPFEVSTLARARVTNVAGYAQQSVDLFNGRLHLEGGLRYDYFRFDVRDEVNTAFSGAQASARLQPKASAAYTPTARVPVTVHFNYGRGIASQDARGVVRDPSGPKIATTDFYQLGTSYNARRFSATGSLFLIDQSNQQVYIPDDGSIEFAGPSRSYGAEVRTSAQLTRHLSFAGGLTQVFNAFYRDTNPRVVVDSAPHTVANGSLTFSGWRGTSASLRYRHTSSYRLDGEDPSVRAAGHDVLDFGLVKRLRRGLDLNLSVDNLTNKRYYETQNYFESRTRPGDAARQRIHVTPGYPLTVTAGITLRLFGKG